MQRILRNFKHTRSNNRLQINKMIKVAIIEASEKEIEGMVEGINKIEDRWDSDRNAQDNLRRNILQNTRLSFKYRSTATKGLKNNLSSEYKNNMTCGLCNEGVEESQEQLEECTGTLNERQR